MRRLRLTIRAPDFTSLNLKNNPVVLGNPDLDAEEITTYEAGIVAMVNRNLFVEVTLFHNELEKLIGSTGAGPALFQNIDSVNSTGIEMELRY